MSRHECQRHPRLIAWVVEKTSAGLVQPIDRMLAGERGRRPSSRELPGKMAVANRVEPHPIRAQRPSMIIAVILMASRSVSTYMQV